jgi:hypothetical protein
LKLTGWFAVAATDGLDLHGGSGHGWDLQVEPVAPLCLSYTIGGEDGKGIGNRPGNATNPTTSLHCIQPLPLLRPEPAAGSLHLNAGKHRHLLANHLLGNGAGGPADQVSTAFAQPEAHRAAMLITQRAGVIAEQPVGSGAAGKADLLLDLLLGHSHAVTVQQSGLIGLRWQRLALHERPNSADAGVNNRAASAQCCGGKPWVQIAAPAVRL